MCVCLWCLKIICFCPPPPPAPHYTFENLMIRVFWILCCFPVFNKKQKQQISEKDTVLYFRMIWQHVHSLLLRKCLFYLTEFQILFCFLFSKCSYINTIYSLFEGHTASHFVLNHTSDCFVSEDVFIGHTYFHNCRFVFQAILLLCLNRISHSDIL